MTPDDYDKSDLRPLVWPEDDGEPIQPGRRSEGSLAYFGIYRRRPLTSRMYRRLKVNVGWFLLRFGLIRRGTLFRWEVDLYN